MSDKEEETHKNQGGEEDEEEKANGSDQEEDNVDQNVFNQGNELIEDASETDFQCINP